MNIIQPILDFANSTVLWIDAYIIRPIFGQPIIFGIILFFLFIGLTIAVVLLAIKLHKKIAEADKLLILKHSLLGELKKAVNEIERQKETNTQKTAEITRQKHLIDEQSAEIKSLKTELETAKATVVSQPLVEKKEETPHKNTKRKGAKRK